MQTLLLAILLMTAGTAQAAFGGCPHGQTPLVKAAQSASPAADCHETTTAAAEPMSTGHHGSSQTLPSSCDIGMSCASALALPVADVGPVYFAAASKMVASIIAGYASHISTPDYPPPRA